MYTLAAVLIYMGGSFRPVPMVVQDLTYQSCTNLINSFKNDAQIDVIAAHCEIQATKEITK